MFKSHIHFFALLALAVTWTACDDNSKPTTGNTEVTAAACRDGVDNDDDGLTDCDDPDCQGFTFCADGQEMTADQCSNDDDDDGDGLVDCADPGCVGFSFCASAVEVTAAACDDDEDNDGDGLVDCEDPDCVGFVFCQPRTETSSAACQDSLDNDGDGLADCADPDCGGFVFCLPRTELTAVACQDGLDNDGDGFIDCADPDCAGFVFCAPSLENTVDACQDDQDNDGDGLADCADPDCGPFAFCLPLVENFPAACQDGLDNDGDGLIDCADPDCRGFVFCLPATELTAVACSDGGDNDGDGLADCDDPDCAGFVFCAGDEESSVEACQDGVDNDGDGLTDCADQGCWTHGFCHVYNGYPLTDSWGAVWDGIQRPAKTWTAARAVCEALGARLPTVTELHRNNATSGTGDLSDLNASSELWTFILNSQSYRMTVRLNDGGINARAEANTYPFRCVWAPATTADFSGYACHGAPGSACATARRFYHVDQWDRPALDQVSAAHECAFLNASLPSVEDWTAIIHDQSASGTWNNSLWATDAMYYSGASPYILHAIVNFSSERAPFWAFDNTNNTFGNWNWPTSVNRFRCLGTRGADEGVNPTPSCAGGTCFALLPQASPTMDHRARRAPIWADGVNRAPLPRAEAAEVCRGLGGSLPTISEYQELIHAGLPFTPTEAGNWLWSANPVYHGNYQSFLVRRSTWTDPRMWYAHHSQSVSWDPGNASYGFRCVWHQTYQESPITCPVDQVTMWDGSAFSCAARAPGDDGGQASGGGWTDAWENRWDVTERASSSFGSAEQICALMGGRLPLPTELHRVRSGGPNPIPNATANFLWTRIPSYRQNYNVMLRLSDASVTDNCNTGSCTNYPFRCVWPTTRGNAFGSMSCSGATSGGQDPCSRLGRRVIDSADRARIYAASAAEECAFLGGALTGLRGLEEAIHAGLPNGDTSTWYWLPEAMYAGNFYQALARWPGVGTTGWYWNNQITSTASLANVNGAYTFRCVFDDILR